ncbi:MAG TPA: alpha/beta hydrolase [Propionibacteriaceae bacterium]|nr:alpha/beta hydrolase [Propionibacteriaceae bacterium]
MAQPFRINTAVGPLNVRTTGDGPPALLWHSLFVDERSWQRVETQLARDRRLILITGPGHGTSGDLGRRYTLDECAAAAAAVLDTWGIDQPVDWLGNAWGGHVGVVFAATWPARCRTLVTLGAPVQALNRVERARTLFLLAAFRLFGLRKFIVDGVAKVLLSPHTVAHDPEAVSLVKDCLQQADPTRLRNAVVSISLRRPDLFDRLAGISAPTLFITGSHHEGWTPEQAAAASQLLAHGSTAVVDNAAYLEPLENPGATVSYVRQFWAANVLRSGPG